jgi:hypothetical protein
MIDLIVEILFAWGYKSRSIPSWIIPLAISALCVAIAINAYGADRTGLAAILLFLAASSLATKVYHVLRRPDPS